MHPNEVLSRRSALIDQQQAIVDRASAKGRNLTRSEAAEFARLDALLDDLDAPTRATPLRERSTTSTASDALARWFLESRSMTEGGPEGVIVPAAYRPILFDRLAGESVGLASGFTVIPTDRDEVHIPKITSDASAAFYNEGAEIDDSGPGLDEVVARPRKLAARVTFSNELRDDSSPAIVSQLFWNLSRSLGLALDAAFFSGWGQAPEIRGLANIEGISEVPLEGASLADLDPFADAIGELEAANANPTAIVMHPTAWRSLMKIREASESNRPLITVEGGGVASATRRSIFGLPVYLTAQLPIEDGQTTMWVYDAPQVLAIRREQLRIEVDSSRLFHQDSSEIRAVSRWDLAVPNPAAVAKITGVLVSPE